MKHRMWPRGLALRLALMFALVSTLLLGGWGFICTSRWRARWLGATTPRWSGALSACAR